MPDELDHLVDEATERGQLRRDNADLREQVKGLEGALGQLRKDLDLAEAVSEARPSPPSWLRAKPKGSHPATPCLLMTDQHWDGVVRPEEVLGLNAYNRKIAYGRTERAFQGSVKLAKDYITGHTYDGSLLLLGGDNFSGEIHEELRETNESTIVDTLVYWLEPLVAGVRLLASEFGKVHVVGVVGNHSRRTRKPRSKLRARDNYDWLLYQLLARETKSDERITVQVPEAADVLVPVHDTTLLFTHGDKFRGGSGISAALAPLLLGEHRLTKRHAAASRYGAQDMAFDLLVCGHFHVRYVLPRVLVGGTLMGFDEFALVQGYEYQPPSQEFFLVAPGRGPILNAPIWVQDRKAEQW